MFPEGKLVFTIDLDGASMGPRGNSTGNHPMFISHPHRKHLVSPGVVSWFVTPCIYIQHTVMFMNPWVFTPNYLENYVMKFCGSSSPEICFYKSTECRKKGPFLLELNCSAPPFISWSMYPINNFNNHRNVYVCIYIYIYTHLSMSISIYIYIL